MKTLDIVIEKFEEIGRFVNIMDRMNGRVSLKHGQYTVNARSVVGVASMFGMDSLELCMYEQQSAEVERQLDGFLRIA